MFKGLRPPWVSLSRALYFCFVLLFSSQLVKPLINIGENQSKSSPNFMIIKITFPTFFIAVVSLFSPEQLRRFIYLFYFDNATSKNNTFYSTTLQLLNRLVQCHATFTHPSSTLLTSLPLPPSPSPFPHKKKTKIKKLCKRE